MKLKKLICGLTCLTLIMSMTACGSSAATVTGSVKTEPETVAATNTNTDEKVVSKIPKYVFLFIGDGMSYPQFRAASDYLGAVADTDYANALPSTEYDARNGAVLDGPVRLNFMDFAVEGSAITYDSCSFAPDSASTATSIATGHKTWSGSINVSEDFSEKYETIAEKLKKQKGYKIGDRIIRHATGVVAE